MKRLTCPLNGPRDIDEFVYGGELRRAPDPDTCSDAEWADYLFRRENIAGLVTEWWQHAPSGYWFLAKRDTVTDEVIETFDPGLIFKPRAEATE
ncbi:MAG: sarcosine oxidase subunit delta [Lautropia sp.]